MRVLSGRECGDENRQGCHGINRDWMVGALWRYHDLHNIFFYRTRKSIYSGYSIFFPVAAEPPILPDITIQKTGICAQEKIRFHLATPQSLGQYWPAWYQGDLSVLAHTHHHT